MIYIYIRYSIIFQDILFRFWPGLGLLDVDWQSHWQSLVVVPLSQIHWRSSEHSSIVAASWASGSRWEEVPMSMLRCWLMTRWLLLFHSYLHHCAPCIGETCKMLQIELFLHTKTNRRGAFCAALFLTTAPAINERTLFAALTKYHKVRGSIFLGDCRILCPASFVLVFSAQALCVLADAETAAAAVQATSRAACIEAHLVGLMQQPWIKE